MYNLMKIKQAIELLLLIDSLSTNLYKITHGKMYCYCYRSYCNCYRYYWCTGVLLMGFKQLKKELSCLRNL